MEIAYVCVNYNSSAQTIDAVRSLRSNSGLTARIAVVDNDSTADDKKNLAQALNGLDDTRVIWSPKNLGYFGGLNLGIRATRETHPNALWMIVGNNDLEFPEGFDAQFIEMASRLGERYAVVAPNVLTSDGIRQNPHVVEGVSWFREPIYTVYYRNYALAILLQSIAFRAGKLARRSDTQLHNEAREIFSGIGACFILTPLFFKRFTELWAPTFLYFEEYFLARQVEAIGSRMWYEPSVTVRHMEHASFNKLPGKKVWGFKRDAFVAYRRYEPLFGPRRPIPERELPFVRRSGDAGG